MPPHKGPQVIRYCVITSTVALGAIAVGLIPQYKVNKGKILCAEFGVKDAQLKEAKTSDYKEAIQQKIDAGKKVSNFAKTDFIEEYCISL